MKNLYICDTSSDCISKVDVDSMKELKKIYLKKDSNIKVGPHGLCKYNNKLIVANSYDNTISIINTEEDREENKFFIGMHCNDVSVFANNFYIICGDQNNVVVFDMLKQRVVEEIPCGSQPHSIMVNQERNIIVVSNMDNDSISIIDIEDNANIKHIRVGAYPTKAIFLPDKNYIVVCESFIGGGKNGSISIISLDSYDVVSRISVGNCPVDICCNEKYCYVSNFIEGNISIVSLDDRKEISRIAVGGMPRGILYDNENIYVGDNFNNLLVKLNTQSKFKKTISIGGEPTGMTFI